MGRRADGMDSYAFLTPCSCLAVIATALTFADPPLAPHLPPRNRWPPNATQCCPIKRPPNELWQNSHAAAPSTNLTHVHHYHATVDHRLTTCTRHCSWRCTSCTSRTAAAASATSA